MMEKQTITNINTTANAVEMGLIVSIMQLSHPNFDFLARPTIGVIVCVTRDGTPTIERPIIIAKIQGILTTIRYMRDTVLGGTN